MPARTESISVVSQRGVGKPDYSKKIATGFTRPGFKLAYRQNLKFFALMPSSDSSSYVWRVDPIAAGASRSCIDGETGLDMPFAVPVGYTLDIFSFMMKPQEDATFVLWLDSEHFVELGITGSGLSLMQNDIVALGTSLVDPTALSAHDFDIKVTNLGTENLEMGCVFYCFYEAVGTPEPPNTKLVKCRICSYQWTVPRETTRVICPKCGQVNIYLALANFRGSK